MRYELGTRTIRILVTTGLAMRIAIGLISVALSFNAFADSPCTALALGEQSRVVQWVAPTEDVDSRSLAESPQLQLQKFDIYWVTVDDKKRVDEILNSGKPIATAVSDATACALKLPRGEHWITMTATNADGASAYAEAVRYSFD